MTISIYACGGTGVNVAKMIRDMDVTINYIDTSVSNLKTVDPEHIFLVEAMDGAGKNRSIAYENFKDVSEDVLLKHKPSAQLNIVISSLAGGSGSVLGPLVTKELLNRGHNTLVIGIDSKQSVIELSNTLKTLKTYKSISDNTGKPVSLFYVDNTSRAEADHKALQFINLLSLLTDKSVTEEFDNSDLRSFLYFDKVTDNAPTLSVLEVAANDKAVALKGTSVVGTILVTKDKTAGIQGTTPEYLATCVVSDKGYENADIRLNSVLGKLSLILESLEKDIQTQQDFKKVNKIRDVEVIGANSDGVFL